MRVLMLDDHVMFLQGLKNLLGLLVSGLTIDIADTLELALQFLRSLTYDLVLLDWHLPDATPEEAIRRLRDSGCLGRIVILSGETSTDLVRHSVELGASGFVPKTFSSQQMLAALSQVLSGQIFLPAGYLTESQAPPEMEAFGERNPKFHALTARQIDAYRLAARGLSNKVIARELDIAESTVKSHLSAVYAALGVRNRTEAAFQASRDGIRIA